MQGWVLQMLLTGNHKQNKKNCGMIIIQRVNSFTCTLMLGPLCN